VGLTNGATHYYAFYNVHNNHYSTGVVLSATTASYYPWEIVEPAAYTNADNLAGLNNGKGWTNSWITTGDGTWTIRTNYSDAANDVPRIPNMPVYPSPAGNVMRITLSNDQGATARRNFAGITTGTVYMAAQLAFRWDGGAGALNRYYGISFMQGGTETGFVGRAGGNDKLAIDSYGDTKQNSSFQINGTEGGDTGNVYLVIAKYDFATKVISAKAFFRTTTVPGVEPTYDVTATVPGAGITRIDGVRVGGGGYLGESIGNLWFDEVRVAQSWETLVQQFGPDATNYAIGASGQVTDGALTGGTYGVTYWFRDPEGITNSAGSPNFDIFNPAGVQAVTDQVFATRTFMDGGRELYASNGANALVASSLVTLGVYTSRWSASDSNGAWTADRRTLSNGMAVTFTVIDDDTTAPVLGSLTVGAGSGLTDGQLAAGGWTFTGLVQDVESGIDATGSPGSDPYPPFYDILNPSGTEAVNNGTFDTSPSDGGGSSSAAALAETAMAAVSSANNALGTWTARVFAANNDNDRTDDRLGVTSTVTFVVSDDDTSGPFHSGFTGQGRTLAGGAYTNAELASGLVVTGLVTDATSGVYGGTSNRYTLFRGGVTVASGAITASFADGTAISSNGQLTVTLVSGDVSTSGSYTLRVFSVNYDLDRAGDTESTTTDIEFTVVAATLDLDVFGNNQAIGDGDATPTTNDWTDFADVLVDGGTLSRMYTITNSGAGSLGIGAVTTNAAGVNKSDFVVTGQPSSPLAAGDTTTFTVQFNPGGAGTRSSIIEFTSTVGTAKSPYTFTIQGTGTYVEVAVSGNGNNIADDDLAPTTTDGTDFGAVGVQGGVILVDLGRHDGGSNGDITTSPDVNGHYWNNFGDTLATLTNGTRVSNLVTVENRLTGIGIQLTSWGWGANGLSHGALFAPYGPSNSLLGNFAVQTATEDYLYAVLSTGQSFKVTGLDAAKAYNLRFFGSRSNITTRTTRYTVGSATVDLDTSGPASGYSSTNRNDHRTVMITNITPSGTGEIDVNVMGLVNDGGSYFGYIGILEIHEVPQDARTFIITNSGNRAMTLGKAAILGTGTSDFVVVSQPGVTLAPSNTTTVVIRFDPTAVGLRTAVVSFATSDDSFGDALTENPFNFAIQGNGVAPSITNFPTSLAFESLLGSTPAAQTYSISNNALGSMLYTAQVTAGSAWLSTAPGTSTVGGAAGQVHTASVAMLSGLVPGVSNGTITIASPSATNSPKTIGVTWTIGAITNPAAATATPDGAEMVRLAWTKNGSHSVLIIHNSSNAPAAPVNGTGYTVGSSFADGSRVIAWSNALAQYEHVVRPGSTNFYAFYSINHNYYSPGVSAGATTATYYAWEIVEPAAYTNSNGMDNRNGGNGWTNAWSAGAWFVTNLQPTAAGQYPTSRGNSLFLPTNTAGDIYRNFPEVSTGRLYLAYVVSYGNNGAGTYGGVQLASNGAGRIFIGMRGGSTVLGVEEPGYTGANSAYGLSAGTNNSHTVLARYDFSTREIAAMAVYRTGTVPAAEPAGWDVTFTVPSGIANAINGVRLNFGGFSGNSVGNTYVDEIRLAQSWANLVQQYGPDATNYVFGGDNQLTDGEVGSGNYGVIFNFRDVEGVTNAASTPNFDLFNASGVQVVTDQTFATRTFMDGGRELYASNGTQAAVDSSAVTLGVYTSRWSAHDSNGAATVNSGNLSNGTVLAITVVDDDYDEPIAAAQNLLINPGFETNAAGWNTFGVAGGSTDQYLNGSYSAFITEAAGFAGIYQDVTSSPGKVYVASLRARIDAGYVADNTWLKLEFKDGGYGDMGSTETSINSALTTNWQTFHLTATAPGGTVYARPVLLNNGFGGSDQVYFDNIVLSEVAPLTVAIGSTYYTADGITTNAQFTLTDGALAGVSGGSPLRLAFGAYDVGSGLARGTTDASSQMNLDIGSWVTDNNTNYSSAESTTYASTLAAGATSVWSFAGANVDSLYTAGTNRMTLTIRDADNDRAGDRLSVTNFQYGYLVLTDDDTTGPVHGGFAAIGRDLHNGVFTNNEYLSGFTITGVVQDTFSGVWAGTSNRYTLSRDGVNVSNGTWTAGFIDGGATSGGALSSTFEQGMMVTVGSYTLTVFSVDYDIDRAGDGTATTSTYSFAVVDAPAAPGLSANPPTLTYHVMLGVDATNNVFAITNIGSGSLYYTNYQTYGAGATGWFAANPTNHSLATGLSRIHTGHVASIGFTNTGTFVATNRVDGNQTNAAQEIVINLVVTNIPTPTAVTVTADGAEMTRLAWDSLFTNVLVVYRSGTPPSADPTNGTLYSVGDALGGGVVIRKTSSTGPRTYEHTGLTPGAAHYYAFYAVNNNRYSTSAVLSATTLTYPAGLIIEQGAYTQGVNLVNGSAGQGWTSNWTVNIYGGSAQTYTIVTNSTTPNFVPMPNYPDSYANRIQLGDLGSGSASSGHAARAFAGYTTGKVYVATRLSYQYSGTGKFAGIALLSNATEKAFFGEIGGQDRILGIDSYGGATVGTSYNVNPYGSGTGANTGNVYVVVGAYDFSTRLLSTWAFYRTVTLPISEPAPDGIATAVVGAINFVNGVRLVAGCGVPGESVGQVYYDEIRVAGSWAGLFGYSEPAATNYVFGGDNVVTDDELGDGDYGVVFNFRDPSGMTNSATRPNFDILNPSGVQVATNQAFSLVEFMDSGREQLASNAVQPGVDYNAIVLGTYTGRYSAFNSNGFSIIDSVLLSNGTPVAFTVVDDDYDEPIPAAQNLLINPGFETNAAGWNTFGVAGGTTAQYLNGSYAGYITEDAGYAGIYQDVTSSPSKVYVVSVRARKDAGYVASDTWLKIEFKDGGFGDVGSTEISINSALSTSWQTFYLTVTSTPGTVYTRPVLLNNGAGGSDLVYFDNVVLSEVAPVTVAIGSTYYTADGITTNAQFTLTDAALAGVSGGNPLRLAFGAYDVGGGLARGTNDVASQMNLDIGSWVTDNNTNYFSSESTTFASTLAAGATSVWRFAGADVDSLFTAGTNRMTLTIRDADNDRAGDRLTVTNFQYGYLVVTDDDTNAPLLSDFRINGATNLTDAQLAAGFALTGSVQDAGSGVNSNTAVGGNDIGVNYDVWSTNAQVRENLLFDMAPEDGAAQFSAGGVSVLVNVAWADRVLGVHTVRVSAADNDEDRTDDRQLVVNSNVLVFSVTDDDTVAPEIVQISSTNNSANRNLHISLDGSQISTASGSSTNVTYTTTDGALANVGATNPLIFWVGGRDAGSGLARGISGATNSALTIDGSIVSNVANFDLSRSTPFAETTNARATNVWTWSSAFSAAEIDQLVTNTIIGYGTNRVAVTLLDADFDRPDDQLTLDNQQVGFLIVTDDDVVAPTGHSFVVFSGAGTNQVYDTELQAGGWSITGLVRDVTSGINVNGNTTSDPYNNISPYITIYNATGAVIFSSIVVTGPVDGAATANASIGRVTVTATYAGEILTGVYTARLTLADNDEDRLNDRSVVTLLDVATFTVLEGTPPKKVDGSTNDWKGIRPTVVESSSISSNEFIWRDREFEQRLDAGLNVNNDLWELRVAANSTSIFFLVKMQNITDDGAPYVAIGVDTDQDPADSDMNFIGDDSDTSLGSHYFTNGNSAMHYPDRQIIVHNIDGTGQRIELYAGGSWYSPPTLGNTRVVFSNGIEVIEFEIDRSDLLLDGSVTARFTVASFQNAQIFANDGDSTTNYAGSDALDSLSIYRYGDNAGDLAQSAWDQEISDGDIDFWFDVRIDAAGVISNAVPAIPVLVGPTNGAVMEQGRPLFTWNASSDTDDEVTSYMLELSSSSNFNGSENQTIAYRVNTRHTNTFYLTPADLPSTQYYWRVRARDKSGALSGTSVTNMLQFAQGDDDTNPPMPFLVYVGTNYVPGLTQTNITDGDLANTNDKIDFAVLWTDASGVHLTNHPPFPSTNIFSALGRITPNWDLVEITGGNVTNQFGYDDTFTNYLGYNTAPAVTTIQYNAFNVTNLDINATYYLSLSAEDEDDDKGYEADPGSDGDNIPLDRAVNTNYLLQFVVVDDDTGTPQLATSVGGQYFGAIINDFLAPVVSNAGTTNVYLRVTDSMFGFSNSTVVGASGNLQNPNFDGDDSSWALVGNPNVSWNGSAGADAGGSGGGLLFDLNHSDDYFGYVQEVSATAGAQIVFSALIRQSGSGSTEFFGTRLEFLDAASSVLQSNSSSLGVNTSTQRVEVTGTAPAGTAKVRVMIVTETPGSPPAVSGYADSAILSGAGGATSVSGTNTLMLVFGGHDDVTGLERGTSDHTIQMNIDAGLYWLTNNVTNYDATRSSAFSSTITTNATSVWTFANFSVANFESLETGGAHRVTVTLPDADNDRTNDRLRQVDAQYGYVTFEDDDMDPPNASLIYVGTNFSFGAGYNETNRVVSVTDGDLVGGAAVDLAYSWYDPSGIWMTNVNGEQNVYSDVNESGPKVRNVSPNWDLTNEVTGDLGYDAIHSPSQMHGVNGDLVVTMVVQNIASVAPEENELGNKWTLTVSAQDLDNDRGNSTNVSLSQTDAYVSRDRSVRTNQPLVFAVIDDDTNSPSIGVSNIATKTDGQLRAGGWSFAWNVSDSFSGIKRGDGLATSLTNEWSPNYDLWTASNVQALTDRVFPNYATLSQTPGAVVTLSETSVPSVAYGDVVLGTHTVRLSVVDNDNDRRPGGTNVDGSAQVDTVLTTFSVIDDDTDPPGRRTFSGATAQWGSGADSRYVIVATNDSITTNRSGAATNPRYTGQRRLPGQPVAHPAPAVRVRRH
jgi:hypothetical protein